VDLILSGTSEAAGAAPLWLVAESALQQLLEALPASQAAWLRAHGFQAERGRLLTLPGADGAVAGAVLGCGAADAADDCSYWDAASLPERLPPQAFRLATPLSAAVATRFALGWLQGGYRLTRFRSPSSPQSLARLVAPAGTELAYVHAAHSAMNLARDLINTPANELGPEELAAAVATLANRHAGELRIAQGQELAQQYPLVHAVGMGSARAPRLIDARWRRPGAPRVTLVGKGVCFDSGGLDLKTSGAMLLMKKDMGGAACALALAQLLLDMNAPVELRLLIPAVENSVGARAFRPGDVWASRRGLRVEIGNTDAEGRLVLADALTDADGERPDLLIDLATLTGAARTALGPELPAVFGKDSALVSALRAAAEQTQDPLWPLPLWSGYDEELGSRVADLNNVAPNAFAGAIIAALFLQRFVTATPAWLHLDMYAWNPKERPGRPVGGEAQCVRALYALIRARFG
jgi:leucyl aminopeptidase